jgi:sedoheptulose-bisphosphatase
VRSSARLVYGIGGLINPEKLAHVFVSPRKRAGRTWEIFVEEGGMSNGVKVEKTEDIAEWNYGDYEGKLTEEIKAMRKERGLDKDKPWDIWRDGCEGGEGPQDVERRLAELIGKIKRIQKPPFQKGSSGDVVVVAHGHILRAFVKRWLKYPLDFPLSMMLEPGGVGGLSYQHGDVKEPAILVGMSFPSKG